jgi:hypothetical protein
VAAVHRRRSLVWAVVSCLAVWIVLVAPYQPQELSPAGLVRLPLEALVLVALLLVVPRRAAWPVAVLVGVLLALVFVLKLLELGFHLALDRPFDALTDTGYAGSAMSLLRDSVGTTGAVASLAGLALLVVALLVGLPRAVLSIDALVHQHRRAAAGGVVGALTVWTVVAATGATIGAGSVASASSAALAVAQPARFRESLVDEQQFAQQLEVDPLAASDPEALSGLRGKDVLLVFVESYGRYALEGSLSGPLRTELDAADRALRREGFGSRSAFLTSPTFGGTSWLAHATLQSGLWVDSERRYDNLVSSRRTTLMALFREEGWRTVLSIPSSESPWPQGKGFYRFHRMYGTNDLGYDGPQLGYAKVPDQYTLEALHRLELSRKGRRPVMAEVDLASSHTPWAPLPHMVPWAEAYDPAVYEPMVWQGDSPGEVWADRTRLREAYLDSITYSLRAVIGFLQRYGDDDLVVVMVGDHQPISLVTGSGASHDVPVSVLAKDRAVLRRLAGWDWETGIRPGPEASVWPMDAFRGRFLDAFDTPLRSPQVAAAPGTGRGTR